MLSNSSGSLVSGSITRYLPYGGYRTTPTQTITDRDFTGQKENRELGLLYDNARFYVPGIGRFASADSIVPDPANPQSYNRYSYVYNSPLNLVDPDGHNPVCSQTGSVCSDGEYDDGNMWTPSHPASPPIPTPPSNLLSHLPLAEEDITGQSGFGANWFSHFSDKCSRQCYPASFYIHTGLDFFAPAGSTVYATVSGEVVGGVFSGDADPNVVIKVEVGGTIFYVVHGHVKMQEGLLGQRVEAGQAIGTLEDLGSNSHVHLGLRSLQGGNRAYNPALFMDQDLIADMSFVSNRYPYYEGESPTSIVSFLYSSDTSKSFYNEQNRQYMGLVRNGVSETLWR